MSANLDRTRKRMHRPRPNLFWTALLAAALLTGCASSSSEPPPPPSAEAPTGRAPTLVDDVLGKTWEWVEFTAPTDRLTIDKPESYTLQFDRDAFVFILADCNRGQANYFQPAVGQIAIHGMSLTKVACPAGSHSTRFVQYLELARTWAMEDGSLLLEQPGSQGTLRFRRRP